MIESTMNLAYSDAATTWTPSNEAEAAPGYGT